MGVAHSLFSHGELRSIPGYDATPAYFLPVISALFTALLTVLGPSFAGTQEPVPREPAVQAPVGFTVGIGSGEVSDGVISNVGSLVGSGLSALRPVFPGLVTKPFLVRVHESRVSMPEALVRHLHPGSGGFALLGQHQIHLVWGEMRRTGADPQGVVTHELVHELLDQWAAPHGRGMPRWFHEGLAQVLAGDAYLGGREEDLIWRLAARRMLSFGDLRDGFPQDPEDLQAAYAQSYSYVSWLVKGFGVGTLLEAARDVDDSVAFERALVWATHRTTLQLEDAWRYHLTHESGASWRLLLDQCFNLLLIASLPLLVVAVVRRSARERRAAERLGRAEQEMASAQAMESSPAEVWPPFHGESDLGPDPTPGELHGPPTPEGFDDRAP
jgi:hypothetical protein